MLKEKVIGFIYRIDYIGNNPTIEGISYAGSKRISSKIKWDKYFGSPSRKGCKKTEEWKLESIKNPNDFKKQIIEYVYEGESIIEKEIEYLRSVSIDIKTDDKWLNFSIPRIGAFPDCSFTKEEFKIIMEKRKKTLLDKTGKEYGNFVNMEKRRDTCLKKYGVDHPNKTEECKLKNSKHKREYFGKMTTEERKLHGLKSLKGRSPNNIKMGSIKSAITRSKFSEDRKKQIQEKRKKAWRKAIDNRTEEKRRKFLEHNKYISNYCNKKLYVTIKVLDDDIILSDFLINLDKKGYGRCGISNRIKNKSNKPVYCRTIKKKVIVLHSIKISENELSMMNPEKL
jgi:hypothetical protein